MSRFVLSAFADEIDPSLQTQMDVLEQHGIRYIEMRGVNGKNLTQYTLEEVKSIKSQLDRRGFRLSAIGSPIGKTKITDEFDAHLELFRHTIEIAKIMETKYIRMFSFFMPEGEDPLRYRDEVMNRWRQFIKFAEGTGLILLHENEKDIYGDTPERCLDLIETLNCDRLKLVFDPANFVQCGVITYPYAFEMLKDHIEYMHIKDAVFESRQVVPSGYGDGHVSEILAALKARGFEGFLSLEPHLADFLGFSDLEPDSALKLMEKDGPKQFAIAKEALDKILSEIGG